MEFTKMVQMILFAKQKQRHRHREKMYGYQGGKGGVVRGGWEELGDWDGHIYATDTSIKKTANKNQLYGTGNSTECSLVT